MGKIVYILVLVLVLLVSISFGSKIIKNNDESLNGVWKYNLSKVWETSSAGSEVLVKVSSINVDKKGNVYCVDRKLQKIFVFGSDGRYLHSIGKKGEGPGEYMNISNIYLRNNKIIVPCQVKFHYFTTTGKYLETRQSNNYVWPLAFVDQNTVIYSGPKQGHAYKTDLLYIYNILTKKKMILSEIGVRRFIVIGRGRTVPSSLIGAGDGNTFHGKINQYLIRRYNTSGKKTLEFTINGRKRIKVSEKIRRKKWERRLYGDSKMSEELIKQALKNEYPYAPFYNGILIHKRLIFVFVGDPVKKPIQRIDIFSYEGKYLYQSEMNFPKDLIIDDTPVFKGNYVYVFAEDEEGIEKLIKFKVDFPTNNRLI